MKYIVLVIIAVGLVEGRAQLKFSNIFPELSARKLTGALEQAQSATASPLEADSIAAPSLDAPSIPTTPRSPFPIFTPPTPSPFSFNPPQDSTKTFDQLFNTSLTPHPQVIVQQLLQEFANIFNPNSVLRQVTSSTPSDYNSVPQAIRDTLEGAFENFRNVINSTLSKGLASVEQSFDRFNETAISTIDEINAITTLSIEKIDQEISKYNETVRDCILDNASKYRDIIPAARNQSIECVNYHYQDGLAIIEQGRNDIAAAIGGAQNLTAVIENCSTNYHLGCYISAIINIRSDTIFLPIRMVRRFAEVSEYVGKTSSKLVGCSAIVSETIAEQSLNVTQTVANCLIEN